MVRRFFVLALLLLATPLPVPAHTVPSLTIEAEFDSARNAVLQVNLDPRLFLSPQPTSLPPVSASWWLSQDAAAQKASMAQATAYLQRVLHFSVGDEAVKSQWKVTPIDSASNFPLTANSAEVHLLLEYRGPLPAVDGDFKLQIGNECAVGVILLTSVAGKPERRPQSLFPGESSRGIKLPPLPKSSGAAQQIVTPASDPSGKPEGGQSAGRSSWWLLRSGHFAVDHLVIALVIVLLVRGRMGAALGFVAAFQAAHLVAATMVLEGWLPHAPNWMKAAGWIALVAGALGLITARVSAWRVASCFAVAGLCHGLDLPHLHLPETGTALSVMMRDTALLTIQQAAVVIAFALLLRLRQGKGAVTSAA